MRYACEKGSYQISDLPGCSQVAVSHSAYIVPTARGLGFGKKAHKARLAKLRELGYDAAICTVHDGNEAQRKILVNNGWTRVFGFNNVKNDHFVSLWVINLQQET